VTVPSRSTPRARPVLDLPIDALLAQADELARGWAIALVALSPLEGIGDVPLAELAREAPSLCAQAIRALESDVELDRLTGHGAAGGREDSAPARRLAALAGALEPVATATGVEAFRGVLWEALRGELREPSSRLVGDACDRLAQVCAELLAAALQAMPAPGGASAPDAVVVSDARDRIGSERPFASPAASDAVIVDERTQGAPEDAARDGALATVREPARAWEAGAPVPPETPPEEIEIRDERREEGPTAWIGSIGAQLERFEQDGQPFAVLLVELMDIERLRREEVPEDLARLAGQMEQALAGALGTRSASLTRERPGRCWVLAPETDVPGAELLAQRLTSAVASRSSHRGLALAVAIGTAVCPDGGREAPALAAHADVSLYAARSAMRTPAGRPVGPVDESE
jgi:GGDEF domain-containing protein